jgi:hypothetical protein
VRHEVRRLVTRAIDGEPAAVTILKLLIERCNRLEPEGPLRWRGLTLSEWPTVDPGINCFEPTLSTLLLSPDEYEGIGDVLRSHLWGGERLDEHILFPLSAMAGPSDLGYIVPALETYAGEASRLREIALAIYVGYLAFDPESVDSRLATRFLAVLQRIAEIGSQMPVDPIDTLGQQAAQIKEILKGYEAGR